MVALNCNVQIGRADYAALLPNLSGNLLPLSFIYPLNLCLVGRYIRLSQRACLFQPPFE